MRKPIVILALILGSCLAGFIIEVPKRNTSSVLIEAMVKILKDCYGNQFDAMSLAGSLDGTLIPSLFEQSIPVTLINNTRQTTEERRGRRKSVRNLQVFVVAVSSSTELTEIVNGVKNAIWWNHLASVIILSWPSAPENECSNAYEMLWTAWKLDLLKAKLLCLHRVDGPMIYGFNPFMDKAPYPWELKKTYSEKNNHPWTLFARRFRGDEKICEEIDFEKTKNLGGYEVRLIASDWPSLRGVLSVDFNKTGLNGLGGVFGDVVKIMYQSLNATCKLIDPNTTIYKLIEELVFNGLSDIMIFPRYQSITINVTTTRQYYESGLGVVTQYSGQLSQLGKLISVIDRTSRYGVCLVFLVTLLFFKFFLRQSLMSGMLNNLRVVLNGSILNVPQNHAPRIYLASLFLFALTIQGLYQGQLASLLTKPISLPNVNTLEDLANSHHAIYGHMALAPFFKNTPLGSRFIAMKPGEECLETVLQNSSVACVKERFAVIDKVVEMNLHLSSDTIKKDYWLTVIRQDWPLEERVNIILQRLVEANLVNYWHNKVIQKSIDQSQYYAKQESNQHFRNITLEELTFAFVILVIGLAFATTIFFAEFFRPI